MSKRCWKWLSEPLHGAILNPGGSVSPLDPAPSGSERGLYAYAISHAAQGVPAPPDFTFPSTYTGIYNERRRECGWQLYQRLGIARGNRAASAKQLLENFRLLVAPHVLVVASERDLGVYGASECRY